MVSWSVADIFMAFTLNEETGNIMYISNETHVSELCLFLTLIGDV